MVMAFFRKGPTGLDNVLSRSVVMLGDTRHTFDLATLALLSETSASDVDTDIRETLRRINELESELWRELIVHVSVQGGADIGSVLGLTLLIKMIERIGDQTRNVLDLAEAGASLSGQPDTEAMLSERQVISGLFGEVAALLQDPDDDAFEDLEERGSVLIRQHQARIEEFLHSDRPGYEAVPRAIYYRYLKRIVANLLGVVRAATEPVPEIHDGAAPAN